MTIKKLVLAIALKHEETGIVLNKPASSHQIQNFEEKIGFDLPIDFKEFYSVCNGFGCADDIFNMTPLEEIIKHESDYGKDWFHFAEYMIYSDMWSLRKRLGNSYEIFNTADSEVILTTSLSEFLERFLKGGVFEEGGLYEWREQNKP